MNNYQITPGQDKFLRLHIDDLTKSVARQERQERRYLFICKIVTIAFAQIMAMIVGIIIGTYI